MFAGKSSISSHLEPPLTRKTTSLLSGQPKMEFLINPTQEPEFQTIDSEGTIVYKGPTPFWSNMAHEDW